VRAHKQFTIARASAVLTIQFKRFDGGFGGKIDKKVDFPNTLDLGPFLSPETRPGGDSQAVYHLYSVLVHAGRSTHSGHYYSFIKAPAGMWHVMDDSRVSCAASPDCGDVAHVAVKQD
jgi:ubiquitin carboxyl-terminal hydrolase 36/42